MRTSRASWVPVMTTVTAPPPAVPSTVSAPSSVWAIAMLGWMAGGMRWRSRMFFMLLFDLQDPVGSAECLERGAEHRVLGRGLGVRCRGRRLLHATDAHDGADELAEVALEIGTLAVPHVAGEIVGGRGHHRSALDRPGLGPSE